VKIDRAKLVNYQIQPVSMSPRLYIHTFVCLWRSIDRLRSIRITSVLKLQLEPMDLNSKIKLTILLLELETSNFRHS